MDTPLATSIFRQLFSTPARGCLQRRARTIEKNLHGQRRQYALRRTDSDGLGGSSWQQRMDHFPADMTKQLREYPRVTAKDLRNRAQRPRRVKMLAREFIDDSLYNPHYGYFPKNATIFNLDEPFEFQKIKDSAAFNDLVTQKYQEFEDDLDTALEKPDDLRQLWHTPTELFRPYYGEAIARWLIMNYKHTLFPYHDLIIYEIGAGNGTLARNILDFIRRVDHEVYQRTKFRIIEISRSLADMQNTNLSHSPFFDEHLERIQIVNRSVFDWDVTVSDPCFFLALEVIDNFSHDVVRYDPDTEQPLQGSVLIDEAGAFFEYYERNLDDLCTKYMRIRQAASRHQPLNTPITTTSRFWRNIRHGLPLAPNLTVAEYLPTRCLQFFQILRDYFPHHRLLLSDFTKLPTSVPGLNAPIVQTRYQRDNVTVTTPFVHQGYFDVFFPTDFDLLEDVYRAVTGKLTRTSSHADFMLGWADIEGTRCKSGENALLQWYQNVGMLMTV